MDQATDVRARTVPGWWFDLVLLAAFVALTYALARGHLLEVDRQVADWADQHRPAALYWPARVLNYLGQGGQVLMPVAVLLAVILAVRRRSVRPVLVVAAAVVLTYLTIGPLKLWLQRAAPHFTGPDRAELFNPAAIGALGMSYPSGHVANAVVGYGVIALLLGALVAVPPAVRVTLRVVPPIIVFSTTTYLAFHWLTDSIAGLFLGVILTRAMSRIRWDSVWLPALPYGWDRSAGISPPSAGDPVRAPGTPPR